jgi:cullin 3
MKGLEEIYKHNESQLSFEELYRNAYMMVIARDGDKLYQNIKTFISKHLASVVEDRLIHTFPPSSTQLTMGDCEGFLRAILDLWDDHSVALSMIRDVMMYLDRTYLLPRNLALTHEVGLSIFRDVVINSAHYPVEKHMVDAVLSLIQYEREQELIDRTLIKSIVTMLQSLSSGSTTARQETLYDSCLEQRLMETTALYYSKKTLEMFKECDAYNYLIYCEMRLEEERQRIVQLFLEKTLPSMTELVQKQLLTIHLSIIIDMPESGLVDMISNTQYKHLELLYKMFGLVTDGHSVIRSRLGSYIKVLGKNVNQSIQNGKNDCGAWMDGILSLKQQFDYILLSCFQSDPLFEAEMNVAFQDIVSSNTKTAESISLYADLSLRALSKGKLEEDFDVISERIITVFRFLNEKDVFERYYKQHLAKRLLNIKTINDDAEKNVLSKLKVEAGYHFTSKLEGMFTDHRLSLELTSDFKKVSQEEGMSCPDLGISVLTSTFWPFTASEIQCALPPELKQLTLKFEQFYLSRHSGRVLTWIKSLGSGDVKVRFDSGTKELNMSTFCMIVLLNCFRENRNESLSFEQIKVMTCISDNELKRALLSLSLGKHRILIKSSKGKDITASDEFQFNKSFTSQLSKIKILTISGSATQSVQDEERDATMRKVTEDRKCQIEAAVVRVMKARKTLNHNNLVSEVIQQLSSRFSPSPLMVKQRIENLIDRDYLDRDNEQRL